MCVNEQTSINFALEMRAHNNYRRSASHSLSLFLCVRAAQVCAQFGLILSASSPLEMHQRTKVKYVNSALLCEELCLLCVSALCAHKEQMEEKRAHTHTQVTLANNVSLLLALSNQDTSTSVEQASKH